MLIINFIKHRNRRQLVKVFVLKFFKKFKVDKTYFKKLGFSFIVLSYKKVNKLFNIVISFNFIITKTLNNIIK